MKKILIVNNNMKVGGVQKSLYNLLNTVNNEYDITLYLFNASGEYVDKLPTNVKIVSCNSLFRFLGISQGECFRVDKLKRGVLALICKVFGRGFVMRILLASQKTLPEEYDVAISYLHNGNKRSFYGGTQDFVLHRVNACKKVAFLHCDYKMNGASNQQNNKQLQRFDVIASCSDGCRNSFETEVPELKNKSITVRNCHCFDEIRAMSAIEPIRYESNRINVVTVARLSHEKGVDRAIKAVAAALDNGMPVSIHIVGSGGMEEKLKSTAKELGVADQVHFYGEQSNPYRFMINADLLFLTSYHEAAPMVIEEARCLGLPVLTTRTVSSDEMVIKDKCGWVCENNQSMINKALIDLLAHPEEIKFLKDELCHREMDNKSAVKQFKIMMEG